MNMSFNEKQNIPHFFQEIEGWFTYADLYYSMVKRAEEGAHFVEVGAWLGKSAAYLATEIHNSGKNIKFDVVDHFWGSDEHTDPNSREYQPELSQDPDWLYNEFLKNTSRVNHIINTIRQPSLVAAELYEDESLDFVFIDAAHDYQSVLDDIVAWFPKVKTGAFICGHDITYHEVSRAVNDFTDEAGEQAYSDNRMDIWFIQKGKIIENIIEIK